MIDFTAHPLFPDLLENQRRSVQYFFEKGILEELELFSYLGGGEATSVADVKPLKSMSSRFRNSFCLLESSKNSILTQGYCAFEDISLSGNFPQAKSSTKISISLAGSSGSFESRISFSPVSPKSLILHASKFVFKHPQFSQSEAIRLQKTYSAGLYIPVSLGGDISCKPQWFYFGEIPLMTERGSFLINGSPRVLVNQIVRCPSVYFKLKLDEKNRRTYIASFLSEYGSWLRLETDRLRPRLWVRIDKSPRFPIDLLLNSLGGSGRMSLPKTNLGAFNRERRSGGVPPSESVEVLASLQAIWKKCNPGRWGSVLGCYSFFYNKFFNPRRYSLGRVGRLRLNKRLCRISACKVPTLTPEDVFLALDYLINLQKGVATCELDDIDHLKNRRVRLPGEIIQNQFRLALSRVMNLGKNLPSNAVSSFSSGHEKSGTVGTNSRESFRNSQIRNPSSIIAAILGGSPPQAFGSTMRELFNTSQLSQYMDQTNPLAEITHKRRLSSLGPGGVGRDQAGFAVREIHPSHFGRICPIETPEGQNAGLVGSLASFARINFDGFLQSPAMVLRSKASVPTCYLFPSDIEDEIYLCTADLGRAIETLGISKQHNTLDRVPTRYKQEFITVEPHRIQFRGICPTQMISVATSLIPFLEHDDANRALMGSNMQRQAVPLCQPEKPFCGTGFELQAARDSSTVLLAPCSGHVTYVDSQEIHLSVPKFGFLFDTLCKNSPQTLVSYLQTYARSNQSTCIRQRPAVQQGDWVEKGDLLADGSATRDGEVSLGKNILLAYMPWEGYNFEDAIVINERLVYEDVYSSIHLERYELDVRNMIPIKVRDPSSQLTNLVPAGSTSCEFITRDLDILSDIGGRGGISALSEFTRREGDRETSLSNFVPANAATLSTQDQIRNLDGDGIVRPGTWIQEGSILVGKITVTGLPGRGLTQSRKAVDNRTRKPEIDLRNVRPTTTPEYRLLLAILGTAEGRTASNPPRLKNTSIKAGIGIRGRVIDCVIPWRISRDHTASGNLGHSQDGSRNLARQTGALPLAPLQIFIAHKKRIQIGDKMSGRHGNKGIVSLILPPQDMPYLQDGTPVDIVLNPLGVPSRMNVGQVLETLFGLASKYLGQIYRLMPFESQRFRGVGPVAPTSVVSLDSKTPMMNRMELMGGTSPSIPEVPAELSRSFVYSKLREARNRLGYQWLFDPNNPGKTQIFDGRTGEVFHQPVLVGYSYMFKLIHLVDDKIHARSTGPYSLVTQQPLGGRSKKGGQRLGEMEVWALEGFGAAYLLQEFLTVKSDEIYSRNAFLLNLMKRRGNSYERTLLKTDCKNDIRSSNGPRSQPPESFRVLVNELQSLCLSVYYNPDFRLSYPSLLLHETGLVFSGRGRGSSPLPPVKPQNASFRPKSSESFMQENELWG